MALILHLETSTTACSVALAEDGKLLANKEIDNGYSHSENLAVFVKDVLANAGKEAKELQAVAVSKGPGSYTGLRIGVSTAKGLCYALGIPLVAVPTLKVLLAAVDEYSQQEHALFCPMLDARRMEVYTALYNARGEELQAVSAKIIDEDSFGEELRQQKVYFFGNGAEKCEKILGQSNNAVFLSNIKPLAKNMVTIAFDKYSKKEFEDVAYFEPFYLKDFVATTPKKLV